MKCHNATACFHSWVGTNSFPKKKRKPKKGTQFQHHFKRTILLDLLVRESDVSLSHHSKDEVSSLSGDSIYAQRSPAEIQKMVLEIPARIWRHRIGSNKQKVKDIPVLLLWRRSTHTHPTRRSDFLNSTIQVVEEEVAIDKGWNKHLPVDMHPDEEYGNSRGFPT